MGRDMSDCTLVITSDDILCIPLKSFFGTVRGFERELEKKGLPSYELVVLREYYERALEGFREGTR